MPPPAASSSRRSSTLGPSPAPEVLGYLIHDPVVAAAGVPELGLDRNRPRASPAASGSAWTSPRTSGQAKRRALRVYETQIPAQPDLLRKFLRRRELYRRLSPLELQPSRRDTDASQPGQREQASEHALGVEALPRDRRGMRAGACVVGLDLADRRRRFVHRAERMQARTERQDVAERGVLLHHRAGRRRDSRRRDR